MHRSFWFTEIRVNHNHNHYPQSARSISADDITGIMHAKVNPARSDDDNHERGEQHKNNAVSGRFDMVPEEKYDDGVKGHCHHCMAAWKAVAFCIHDPVNFRSFPYEIVFKHEV